MAFSLSGWFKGKPGSADPEPGHDAAPAGTSPAPALPPMPPAPPAVRTVLPSAAPVNLLRPPSGPSPANAKPPVTRNVPMRPPARKVSFPMPPGTAPAPVTPTAPPPVAMKPIPPAPVLLPEAPDVTVSLEVGDFIDRIPPGFLSGGAVDRSQVVAFRASELYSDLAKGKASVPASTIYAKCPEIFARAVSDEEDAEITLPLQKLVEQMSAAFTTRTDQVAEENVGEIETPFLQVANEDNARLTKASGTSAGAIRPAADLPFAPPTEATASTGIPQRPAHRTGTISTISAKPVVEPPAAPTFSPPTAPINPGKRPPSTVRASVAGGKIRLSGAAAVTRIVPGPNIPPLTNSPMPAPPTAPSSASPSHQVTKKTARIQIPPISLRANGTGAAPRPGSVPPPPSVPVQPSPVSIRPPTEAIPPVSFRTSPPVSRTPAQPFTAPPSFAPPRATFPPPAFPAVPPSNGGTPPPPVAPAVLPPPPSGPADDRKIELGLAAVLRGQPSAALAVEPSDVPDDVRLTLPFALIEKQLSTGRVLIARQLFVDALPEDHRNVLAEDSGVTEVQIPLQEVFQNLPGNALSIRNDQVVEEVADLYPTPFKQKADEDAQRLGAVAPVAPVPLPIEATEPEPTVETLPPFVEDSAPAEAPEDVASAEPEAAEESFASIFGEEPTATAALIDQPLAPVEEPVVEEASAEPARDLPLDQDETPVEAPVFAETPEEPNIAPVVEALAVSESTAPAEDEAASAPVEARAKPKAAAVIAPDTELQTLFMTEDELDAKGVVRLVCQLPGITGCAVLFADGLRLAGNFPDGDAEGFSAMAPPFFKRTGNFAHEAILGALNAVTLYTDKALISFFMHDDICLSVRHTGRGFQPGVREKLTVVTRELARMYSSEKPSAPQDYLQ